MVYRPTWTDQEKLDYLRTNWRKRDRHLARTLGITRNAVYKKRLRLGLAKNQLRRADDHI